MTRSLLAMLHLRHLPGRRWESRRYPHSRGYATMRWCYRSVSQGLGQPGHLPSQRHATGWLPFPLCLLSPPLPGAALRRLGLPLEAYAGVIQMMACHLIPAVSPSFAIARARCQRGLYWMRFQLGRWRRKEHAASRAIACGVALVSHQIASPTARARRHDLLAVESQGWKSAQSAPDLGRHWPTALGRMPFRVLAALGKAPPLALLA
ncbi:hypothetical protein D3C81_1294320 [compost metagenome]